MAIGKRVRLRDVAHDAGVSPATVSRAIAQPDLVNPETLVRVKRSAARLGYVPDGAARALASGRSMTIGAVVPTLDSMVFSHALQSMQLALSRKGFQLLVASHDYNSAGEAEAIRNLLARGVDGLMLVGAERPQETWDLLESSNVATVLTWCGDRRASSIIIDNEKAGWIAARHLLDLGHKRIAAVVGALRFNDRQKARLAGIRLALREAALDFPDWLICEQPLTLAGGRAGCELMLGLKEAPTAVIGGIDVLAMGCIEEAHSRGLAVPDDLSVVGIDNIEMSAHIFPSMTSVHLPVGRIGERAADCLIERLSGNQDIVVLELPVELVPRTSSRRI